MLQGCPILGFPGFGNTRVGFASADSRPPLNPATTDPTKGGVVPLPRSNRPLRLRPGQAPSAPFLGFVFCDPRLHQLFHQRCRQRLVGREADGPFGDGVALEFVLEPGDHGRAREQTAMVGKGGVPHQHALVLERGNPVADGLGGLRRRRGANRRANLFQSAARGFRDARLVFLYGLHTRGCVCHTCNAITGLRFFHASKCTGTDVRSQAANRKPEIARLGFPVHDHPSAQKAGVLGTPVTKTRGSPPSFGMTTGYGSGIPIFLSLAR